MTCPCDLFTGWWTDVQKQLKLPDAREFTVKEYGKLPGEVSFHKGECTINQTRHNPPLVRWSDPRPLPHNGHILKAHRIAGFRHTKGACFPSPPTPIWSLMKIFGEKGLLKKIRNGPFFRFCSLPFGVSWSGLGGVQGGRDDGMMMMV